MEMAVTLRVVSCSTRVASICTSRRSSRSAVGG